MSVRRISEFFHICQTVNGRNHDLFCAGSAVAKTVRARMIDVKGMMCVLDGRDGQALRAEMRNQTRHQAGLPAVLPPCDPENLHGDVNLISSRMGDVWQAYGFCTDAHWKRRTCKRTVPPCYRGDRRGARTAEFANWPHKGLNATGLGRGSRRRAGVACGGRRPCKRSAGSGCAGGARD